ncbi:hypothetical protein QBC39DRAFT_142762 [Podospora conica]|nr:hypothetical protein QBC39DRAFT_142762 [Schizothecium conicum]
MCQGNFEKRVCKSSLDKLLRPGSRLLLGPPCQRAIWQHVIRYKLDDSLGAAILEGWDGPDGLLRRMFLVRPDGTPWSRAWQDLVIPKVQQAIRRRASEAVSRGLATYKGRHLVWADWAQGFLSSDWDGVSLDEQVGWELLGKAPAGELEHSTPSATGEQAVEIDVSPRQSPTPAEEPTPEEEAAPEAEPTPEEEDQDEDARIKRNVMGWLQETKTDILSQYQAQGHPSTLGPWDSQSQVNNPRRRPAPISQAQHLTKRPEVGRPGRPPPRPLPAIAEDNTSESEEEEDEEEDEAEAGEDDAYWASLSLDAITQMLRCKAEMMVDIHHELTDVQIRAAACGNDAAFQRTVDMLRDRRETVLEQLCFLEDQMDGKLQERYGLRRHWPFSSIIWSSLYWDVGLTSPIQQRRAYQRDQQGHHLPLSVNR